MKHDRVESEILIGALPPVSEGLAELQMFSLEEIALALRVVEDRESRFDFRIRMRMDRRIELRRPVIAGECIRIAKEQRISIRELQTPIEISADSSTDEELRVFHPIERRRRETVAL